jgi:hypothetical protein
MTYTVLRSEASLWTVGFHKPDGKWEPESDHGTEREAKVRAHDLNGVESEYVYMRTEPGLWTVGSYYGGAQWTPESDHGSAEEAAERVMELNR